MLDLGNRKQKLYSIKLADKTVLKIRKPTQAMLLTMLEMRDADAMDEGEVLEKLYDLMLRIFNLNSNNRVFAKEDIAAMLDIETAMVVLEDYMKFTFDQLGES